MRFKKPLQFVIFLCLFAQFTEVQICWAEIEAAEKDPYLAGLYPRV